MKTLLLVLLSAVLSTATCAVEVGDDGLHKQPWLEVTFKDIREDIETAREDGKRLAIIFEQRGCPFCEKMHETVLIDPDVVAYIEAHYFVVQFNLHGDEEVTDLDGEALSESEIAQKWSLKYTPTLLFLPSDIEEGKSAVQQAVASMPGAPDKETTLSMLRWVVEHGYESSEDFQSFHTRRLEQESSKSL